MPSSRLLAALVVVVLFAGSAPPAAAQDGRAGYRRPVEGPVIDPFRPPSTPYGPGNLGLEYATRTGSPVVASLAGRVVFAGPVGGALHVTILHPDGLRTSYSFVRATLVRAGDEVDAGEVIARAGRRLHFGVRAGDEYLDPASVLDAPTPRPAVRLVPVEPWRSGSEDERSALREVVARGSLEVGWSLDRLRTPWARYATDLYPPGRAARLLDRWARSIGEPPPCTPPGTPPEPPDERRIAVLVGGLGTTGARASVDRVETGLLGYDGADVVRFSYLGGRVPGHEGSLAPSLRAIAAVGYSSAQSQGDLMVAGDRLRSLIEEISSREPGVPIDVIAHSQGGIVARVALATRPDEVPAEVAVLATIGSPHRGADLATGAVAVASGRRGSDLLARVSDRFAPGLDADGVAVGQLAETADLIAWLHEQPLPRSVRAVSIGARGDLTVPAGQTVLDGAGNPVVSLVGPDAHTVLPGDRRTTRELALVIAGRPPTCESASDRLTDLVVSESISWTEDVLGFGAAVLAR